MRPFANSNLIRSRLAGALFVALLALALPHAAHAQPILKGKQQALPASTAVIWQPVSAAFSGPGLGALPEIWTGVLAQRLTPPVIIVEHGPIQQPAIEMPVPLPIAPWMSFLMP